MFRHSKDPVQLVNTILNGGVEEVTRRPGCSTICNGQTVPKLSKPSFHFYCLLWHNIKFVHNGLKQLRSTTLFYFANTSH